MPDRFFKNRPPKPVPLSEQIRQLILSGPESVNNLARRAGVDQSTLNKFVRGQRRNLRLDTAQRVCEALGAGLILTKVKKNI